MVELDERKFRELILYLAERSIDDPKFGKTKLAKLLYYSDFYAYALLGRPISGATYARYPRGPVPRALARELNSIEDTQDGVIAKARYHTREQQRLVALREADLSVFTAAEISVVDRVIEALKDHDATDVSALSHLEAGWKCVQDYADIPYDLVFVSSDPPSPETVEWAQAFAAEAGLLASA